MDNGSVLENDFGDEVDTSNQENESESDDSSASGIASDLSDDKDIYIEVVMEPTQHCALFTSFIAWLTSVDGKAKPFRSARQQSRQVQTILRDSSGGSHDVDILLDRKALRDSSQDLIKSEILAQ